MDWQTLIIKVAIGAVCALASGLISWLLLKLKTLVSSKVKNAKAKELLTAALNAIEAATKATQQTFVDNIKRTDRWTKEAQQVALTNAVNTATRLYRTYKRIAVAMLTLGVKRRSRHSCTTSKQKLNNTKPPPERAAVFLCRY